jgi:uncharacterized protein (UPF0548 family)
VITLELSILLGFAINLIGAAIGYGKLQGKIEDLKEKVKNMERWRSDHDRDVAVTRTAYDLKLTDLQVRLGRGEEKFEQISRDMIEIKGDLKTLLGRRRDDRESA